MGAPYQGADAFPTEFPIADDADPPKASTFGPSFEALGDRTWFLKQRLDALVPLANLTALGAILAPPNKMVRMVEKLGWYIFDSSASNSDYPVFAPFVIAAADLTPGRWIRVGYYPHFREQGIDLSRCLVGRGENGIALATRDKNANFYPDFQTWYAPSPGAVTSKTFARMTGGQLVMKLEPIDGAGSYGFQWCIDDVLGAGSRVFGVTAQSKILGASFAWLPATGRGALPSVRQASIGLFRCPRLPGSGSATPVLESLNAGGDFTEVGAADVAEYETNQSVPVVANQYNSIELGKYTYYVQVWNEEGTDTLANNGIGSVTVSVSHFVAQEIGGLG